MIDILTEKVSGELEMLQRHLVILKQVVENEPIGILKLAEETKIRATRCVIHCGFWSRRD